MMSTHRFSSLGRALGHLFLLAMAGLILLGRLQAMGEDASPNLIVNGGFEDGLGSWEWFLGNKGDASLTIDRAEKHSGQTSLRLACHIWPTPNVFGALRQRLSLKSHTQYILKVWVKGLDASHNCLACGEKWDTRVPLPEGTYDWQQVAMPFNTGDESDGYPVLVLTDGSTKSIWIDDVSVVEAETTPRQQLFAPSASTGVPAEARFYPLMAGKSPDDAPMLHIRSQDDRPLGADVQMVRDDDRISLLVNVIDPMPGQAIEGADMWRSDSIQLALDMGTSEADKTTSYVELGLALLPTGEVANYTWVGNFDWSAVPVTGKKTAAGYQWKIAIPWGDLGLDPAHLPSSIGMNLVVNGKDAEGNRRFVEWTPGTAIARNLQAFARLTFPHAAPAVSLLALDRSSYDSDAEIEGRYVQYASSALPALTLHLAVHSPTGELLDDLPNDPIDPLPPNTTRIVNFLLSAKLLKEEGTDKLVAEVKSAGDSVALPPTSTPLVRLDLGTRIANEYASESARLAALKTSLAAKPQLANDPYIKLGLVLSQRFIDRVSGPSLESNQSKEWPLLQLNETKEVLDWTEERINKGAPALVSPRPTLGPVTLKDGILYATEEGSNQVKPFYYDGFLCFGDLAADAPVVSQMGATLIQREEGSGILQEDGTLVNGGQGVLSCLKEVAQSGMKLDLLLSPHYVPAWLFQKYPDAQNKSSTGWFKQVLDHPASRDLLEKYLRAMIPKIKDDPGLLSVCLSNEPTYALSGRDPYSAPLWAAFLQRRHSTIAALNKLYGTAYKNFADVPAPKIEMPDEVPAQRAYYDWIQFNQEHFADWHRWMNGIIKSMAPTLPTSSKIMNYAFDRANLALGVDPELFCDITDFAGNDCWAYPESVQGYAYGWEPEEMWYDLLHSFRGQAVYNSENHFIPDSSPPESIPAESTRAVVWQGALHHQALTALWLWTEPRDHDSGGSVYLRPANSYAAGQAMLDLNRLSEEVTALNQATGKVAILYSMTSLFWDKGYGDAAATAYAALDFMGQPVTFISDRQLSEGTRSPTNRDVGFIILPEASRLSDATVKALVDFVKKGGKIIALGSNNLRYDEYDRERRLPPELSDFPQIAWHAYQDKEIAALMQTALGQRGLKWTPLHDVTGHTAWGVEYRTVQRDGHLLVALTNLLNVPQIVTWPTTGPVTDLVSNATIDPGNIVLKPAVPVLLRMDSGPTTPGE